MKFVDKIVEKMNDTGAAATNKNKIPIEIDDPDENDSNPNITHRRRYMKYLEEGWKDDAASKASSKSQSVADEYHSQQRPTTSNGRHNKNSDTYSSCSIIENGTRRNSSHHSDWDRGDPLLTSHNTDIGDSLGHLNHCSSSPEKSQSPLKDHKREKETIFDWESSNDENLRRLEKSHLNKPSSTLRKKKTATEIMNNENLKDLEKHKSIKSKYTTYDLTPKNKRKSQHDTIRNNWQSDMKSWSVIATSSCGKKNSKRKNDDDEIQPLDRAKDLQGRHKEAKTNPDHSNKDRDQPKIQNNQVQSTARSDLNFRNANFSTTTVKEGHKAVFQICKKSSRINPPALKINKNKGHNSKRPAIDSVAKKPSPIINLCADGETDQEDFSINHNMKDRQPLHISHDRQQSDANGENFSHDRELDTVYTEASSDTSSDRQEIFDRSKIVKNNRDNINKRKLEANPVDESPEILEVFSNSNESKSKTSRTLSTLKKTETDDNFSEKNATSDLLTAGDDVHSTLSNNSTVTTGQNSAVSFKGKGSNFTIGSSTSDRSVSVTDNTSKDVHLSMSTIESPTSSSRLNESQECTMTPKGNKSTKLVQSRTSIFNKNEWSEEDDSLSVKHESKNDQGYKMQEYLRQIENGSIDRDNDSRIIETTVIQTVPLRGGQYLYQNDRPISSPTTPTKPSFLQKAASVLEASVNYLGSGSKSNQGEAIPRKKEVFGKSSKSKPSSNPIVIGSSFRFSKVNCERNEVTPRTKQYTGESTFRANSSLLTEKTVEKKSDVSNPLNDIKSKTTPRKEDSHMPENTVRSSGRCSRRKAQAEEPIEIFSSDSEAEFDEEIPIKSRIDASRISIGSKVYDIECHLDFVDINTLSISYRRLERQRAKEHVISLAEGVLETKCFDRVTDVKECDSVDVAGLVGCFIALRLPKKLFSVSTYSGDEHDFDKGYVVIEFKNRSDFQLVVEKLKSVAELCIDEACLLDKKSMKQFCKALTNDSNQSFERRSSLTSRFSFLQGKDDNDILLVYPFLGDKGEIEKAANGLNEASCSNVAVSDDKEQNASKRIKEDLSHPISTHSQKDLTSINGQLASSAAPRGHYISIRFADFARLEPEEYLNDTLVDFWFQWIWRNETKNDIHIFTTHFYSTLAKRGPSEVKKWTEKKGIDIFTKKFIFVPVNPGAILVFNEKSPSCKKQPLPCFLFFDSLKAHPKNTVVLKLRKWLNAEWERLGKGEVGDTPFNPSSMEVFAPHSKFKREGTRRCSCFHQLNPQLAVVPYQNNTWDCGVFVCRYGYAMYLLRSHGFLLDNKRKDRLSIIQDIIDSDDAFKFDMQDIARIRNEMMTLIERLSSIYEKWSETKINHKKDGKKSSATNQKDVQISCDESCHVSLERPPLESIDRETPIHDCQQNSNSPDSNAVAGLSPTRDSVRTDSESNGKYRSKTDSDTPQQKIATSPESSVATTKIQSPSKAFTSEINSICSHIDLTNISVDETGKDSTKSADVSSAAFSGDKSIFCTVANFEPNTDDMDINELEFSPDNTYDHEHVENVVVPFSLSKATRRKPVTKKALCGNKSNSDSSPSEMRKRNGVGSTHGGIGGFLILNEQTSSSQTTSFPRSKGHEVYSRRHSAVDYNLLNNQIKKEAKTRDNMMEVDILEHDQIKILEHDQV